MNEWMSHYYKICDVCDPDNEYITMMAMHDDCYHHYIDLINLRIEFGIRFNCLDKILGADDQLF